MAAGIQPGSFQVKDKTYPLLDISFGMKAVQLGRIGNQVLNPNPDLAQRALAAAWPVMKNSKSTVQSHAYYRNSVLFVFIESEIRQDGQKVIHIGDSQWQVPQQVNKGKLDFLVGFSSANTQFVYLGEYSRGDEKTNKRILFMKENGFEHAAADYARYYFKEWSNEHQRILNRAPATEADKKAFARKAVKRNRVAAAVTQNKPVSKNDIPPLLKHKDAWQAYTNHYANQKIDVPKWVFEEFLDPLGYNKRVPRPVDQPSPDKQPAEKTNVQPNE